MNPFQADFETRRAVSTVPPMTTHLYTYMMSTTSFTKTPDSWRELKPLTRVSWMLLEPIPSGESTVLRRSIVRAYSQVRPVEIEKGEERRKEGRKGLAELGLYM